MRQSGLLALVLLAACSSVPETSYYLLTSSTPAQAMGARREQAPAHADGQRTVHLGLGRIEIATYLQQPSLILETADYQIRPATYHRWAEPLPRGVRRALRENLSAALPGVQVESLSKSEQTPDFQLNLEIERFHGTERGTVVLGGRWSIESGDGRQKLASEVFDYHEDISQPGYLASVGVQAKLLAQLSDAIATRVVALDDTGN